MPELFSRMDIGEMDFNRRYPYCRNRISQRNTGMGVRCGVNDNHIKLSFCLLNPTDQFTFKIGLSELDPGLQFGGPLAHFCLNVSQSHTAINRRLALAQQIQIRSVQEENFHLRQAE